MESKSTVDIKKTIEESVVEVFDTMLSMQIESGNPDLQPQSETHWYVAVVKFVGEMVGIVNIQMSWDFAQAMTASMLGIEPGDIESQDEVKDLIAELANIIGGKLKSSYTDIGLYCELSPPSITVGSNFTIKSLNMELYEQLTFDCQGHVVLVEAGVKQGSAESAELKATKTKGKRRKIDVEKYRDLNLKEVVVGSTVDVFETMLSMEAELNDTVTESSLEGVRTVGSVNFAGDITGIINIHITHAFARKMTATMLGMQDDEIEGQDEINDLIGEISNIIGGNLKSTFTDTGLICELSTPSITTGSDFAVESLNMTRYDSFAFRSQGHDIFVEVGVKVSESLQPAADGGKQVHYRVAPAESESTSPAAGQEPATPSESSEHAAQSAVTAAGGSNRAVQNADAAHLLDETGVAAEPEPETQENRSERALDMDVILDIPLDITVELGRTRIPIHELLQLGPGSAVSLSRLESEPVDILANNTLIAKGVVVIHNEKYGIRITELTSRLERLRSIG